MWNLLGGAIGALGSIYGAQQATGAQERMNAENIQAQELMNQQNLAQQLNFAQNSRTWAAMDVMQASKDSGLNPLSLLGLPAASYSNMVAPQGQAPDAKAIAGAYSNAGQSLGNAISRIQSSQDQQFDQATKMLTLQKGQLENEMLRSQINKLNAPGQPPGVPPFAEPGVKAGVTPDVQMTQTASGDLTVTPPKDIAALGFFHPASLSWYARNGLLPAFDSSRRPESMRGDDTSFNPVTMTYEKHPGQSSFGYWFDRNKWFGNLFQ